ncbi:MAG: maleate cis-trans isomerase family protein [bacterium]
MNKILENLKILDLEESIDLQDIAPDGRIGIVALSTDYNLEQDIRRMLPSTIEVFTNRVLYLNPMTSENLLAMAGDIERAAGGILPGLGVNVAIYGCTSGTAVIGFDRIRDLIQKAHPDAPVTTPLIAGVKGLKAVGAAKLSVLTPYNREINQGMVDFLENAGFEVVNLVGLGFDNDLDVTRVTPEEIVRLGVEHFDPSADALFISCTAFRASLAIEELERKLGKPAVSSNQALAWHCMQLLGCDREVKGFGSLFNFKAVS